MSRGAVRLDGKKVLITGAARGLGAAMARAAAVAGAAVVLADILAEPAEELAAQLREEGASAHALPVDLEQPGSIETCATNAAVALGGLDGLVNNGAIATGVGGKGLEEIDLDTWDRVMRVNVRGTWLMSRACLPALRASGAGKIVNLASDTALWGAPLLMAYVASKGAVISMTRSMARELGSSNIAVNALAPGLTLVEATEYVPRERKEHYVAGRAMQREQFAGDITGTVMFLLSDGADFITGQTLPVNGGFVFN